MTQVTPRTVIPRFLFRATHTTPTPDVVAFQARCPQGAVGDWTARRGAWGYVAADPGSEIDTTTVTCPCRPESPYGPLGPGVVIPLPPEEP